MEVDMKVLVVGGTGLVGSYVVSELLARKVDVRVLVHSAEKIKNLPAGVEGVVGELVDPSTLDAAFAGVDRVFLLIRGDLTEAAQGLFAIQAAKKAGVKRIVYMSVQNVEGGVHIPQFGAKLPIELALKASGIGYTILHPTNFFQNDLLFKDALMEYDLYPWPFGQVGCTRVDVRDVAEAAAIALTTDGHEGKTYAIAGPDVLTGTDIVKSWSKALGKPIVYMGDDLDAWETMFLQYMPVWQVSSFKIMNDFFIQEGLIASADDIERLTKLLGHKPRSFDAFTKEAAEAWKS
jgi:uncharacterized protein YbjT (DUF2867 family)